MFFLINAFIQQEIIKLIKSDRKDIYKDFHFKPTLLVETFYSNNK